MLMLTRLLLIALLVSAFCTSVIAANDQEDFPTLERVEFVLGCIERRSKDGNQHYDALYGCVCAIDHIRSQFNYDEYNEAVTFSQLRRTAGERGSLFRDPTRADMLRDKLSEVEQAAEKRCFTAKTVSAN